MTYLDFGATSLHKPRQVGEAVRWALENCANPGRGAYAPSRLASQTVFRCRERAGQLFDCDPEQVVFTSNCTHGLNIAIRSVVKPGSSVAVSGFEHNAVIRPLHGQGARLLVAGRKLFDWEDTLSHFEDALKSAQAAVFTHVSNVFGYILPVEQMAGLCQDRGIPFIIDAAQSAGSIPVSLKNLGADFIAMPGHKGLLGPQGTGILLCGREGEPLMMGGTGSDSIRQDMPEYLPERLEAGTVNVPGIAGLSEGLRYLTRTGVASIGQRERRLVRDCAAGLEKLGFRVFSGPDQGGTVSFLPHTDCEEFAEALGRIGFGVRAGLHCAPLAHESAGTLETGTVRVSFGWNSEQKQTQRFLSAVSKFSGGKT